MIFFIELDVDLVKKAMEITHIDTMKEVVHHSLRELGNYQKLNQAVKRNIKRFPDDFML